MFQTMLNDHIKFMMSVIVVVVVVMQGSITAGIVSAFKKIPMLTGNDSIDGMSFKLQRISTLIDKMQLFDRLCNYINLLN